jgi:hypothetical protein
MQYVLLDAKARQKACLIDLGAWDRVRDFKPGCAGLCLLFFGLSKALLA